MEKKKPAPQASVSSDGSSSNEEEGSEQDFVRSDRNPEIIGDKKANKAAAVAADEEDDDEEEDDQEEEEDDDDDDDDGGGGGVDGTQGGTARDNTEGASSSDTTQAADGHGESNSSSETSSASAGKLGKPSHQFVVIPRKAENANGPVKKTPTLEKPAKARPAPEISPKKSKARASKRDRNNVEPQEKGSTKKQKKESSDKPAKTEKVNKEKSIPSHTSEKKTDGKKSVQSAAVAANPKSAPPQQNSSKKHENTLAKKTAEKSKTDKKASKDAEPESIKGPVSPSKPKTFSPRDELVLTTEILHDINQGIGIPVKKVDGYWSTLADRVKERMEEPRSKEQLCDKVKRMKVRYTSMAEKFKDSGGPRFRNSSDKELFGLWDQIWGTSDAMNVDNERDVSAEVKDKQPKALMAASAIKEGKASRSKLAAPIQESKIVHEESEGPKMKQIEKGSSDDDDDSETEESDGEGDSHKKGVPATHMEVDRKDVYADHTLIPKGNAVQGDENKARSYSIRDSQNRSQEEIRATLVEIQETLKQALKEWQSEALVVVENALKAVADQSRLTNGLGVAGFDRLNAPLRCLDLMDWQRTEGDEALQQQWHEVQLRELDLYHQKLELMQRECQLKHDQLNLQLRKSK